MSQKRTWKRIGIGGLIAVLLLAVAYALLHFYAAPTPAYTSVLPATPKQHLDHVVIVLEENKAARSIIGNSSAAYINNLAKQGSLAASYYDVAKPSLPNYLALTSGTHGEINRDCSPSTRCQITDTNIADRLEQAHKTWREYAESMPAPCTTHNAGNYAARHNPFMYYPDITGNSKRCDSHVVNFAQLQSDFASVATTPAYSFVTPNLCNDMHNCSVATGDAWLKAHVPVILNSPAFKTQNSLLVVVWDEGSNFNHRIVAIFAGPAAKAGYVSHQHYDHYALLRTLELNLGIEPLDRAEAHSPVMSDMLTK